MSGFECDNERNIKTSGVKYYVYTVVDREPSLYIYIYIYLFMKRGYGTPPWDGVWSG